MPIGKGLLFAEPIYLQAERSPMPELRLVVLALQDRLAYGPTFDTAIAGLFGSGVSTTTAVAPAANLPRPAAAAESPGAPLDVNTLIAGAAQDLSDYQRLTAAGKLGEAGLKLEELKQKLDRLSATRR